MPIVRGLRLLTWVGVWVVVVAAVASAEFDVKVAHVNDLPTTPFRPHYDVRTAAQSYSNVAAILAGFAVAAIVLIVQLTLQYRAVPSIPSLPDASKARDRSGHSSPSLPDADKALVALLSALFGCVLAAFNFAVISGELEVLARSYSIAILGGGGFGLAVAFMFWGLAVLIRVVPEERPEPIRIGDRLREYPGASAIARMAFFMIAAVVPPFIALPALDIEIASGTGPTGLWDLGCRLFWLVVWSYIGIFGSLGARQAKRLEGWKRKLRLRIGWSGYRVTVMFALVLIMIGLFLVLVVSSGDRHFRITRSEAAGWAFLHSLVLSALIVLLPEASQHPGEQPERPSSTE